MIIGISGLAGSGKNQAATYFREYGPIEVALADPLKRIARDVYAFTDEQLWGSSEFRNMPDRRYPRQHSWSPVGESRYVTCNCCGTQTPLSLIEDDVWAPDPTDAPCHLTARYALQLLGTEWGRHLYPDTWVEYVIRTHDRLQAGGCAYDQKRGLFTCSSVAGVMQPRTHITIPDVRFRNEIEGIRKAGGKLVRIRRPGAGLQGSAGLHPSEREQASIPDTEFDLVLDNAGTLDDLRALVKKAAEVLGLPV